MNTAFRYTILRFRPSIFLGEQVNVGLLFCFADSFEFIFTTDWQRPVRLTTNISPQQLKTFAYSFRSVVEDLDPAEVSTWSDKKLYQKIMPEPSNALYFSEFRHGWHEDKNWVLNYYKRAFFKRKPQAQPQNEAVRQFEEKMGARLLLTPRKTVGGAKFDFLWRYPQNEDREHLVKFLDLKNKILKTKLNYWLGKLTALNRTLKEDHTANYQIDLVLTLEPKSTDSKKEDIHEFERTVEARVYHGLDDYIAAVIAEF